MGFWSQATTPSASTPALPQGTYLDELSSTVRSQLEADPDAATKLTPVKGKQPDDLNLGIGDGNPYDPQNPPKPPWLITHGTKRIFQEGEFSDTDRWAPGAEEAAMKNATYDSEYGLLYDIKDVHPYWIPEKTSFMDKLVPGLIVGAATGGIGSGLGAAIGSNIAGQAAARAVGTVMQGGSFKDALVSAGAGAAGAGAGQFVSGSGAVRDVLGKTGANIAGKVAGGLTSGAVAAGAGKGSFEDALTRGVAAGVGGAVGASTGSPVAESVTRGLVNVAGQMNNLPEPKQQQVSQAPTTPSGSFSSGLNWGWLTSGSFSSGLNWGWLTRGKRNG